MSTATVPARASRSRVVPIERQAVEFLTLKRESDLIGKRMTDIKKSIMEVLANQEETDEKGSKFYGLSKPIESGGKTYTTLKRERVLTQMVDEDEAETILTKKGLYDECLVLEPRLDHDKVYALYQEGKISEAEIDRIFTYKESFRLQTLV